MSLQSETGATPQSKAEVVQAVQVQPSNSSASVRPKSLHRLAAEIKREHAALTKTLLKGLCHARQAGDLLHEAKARMMKHGDWSKWLESHCGFSKRSAEAYMRIADRWHEIEAKAQSVADLTINEALRLIAKPKDAALLTAIPVAGEADAPSSSTEALDEANDETPAPSGTVPMPTDERHELDERIVALQESLREIGAHPATCDVWEKSVRVAVAEKLLALKAVVDQVVAVLNSTTV